MDRYFLFFLVIIGFISCDKDNKVIVKYDNGATEAIHYYGKDNKIDSSYIYYPSQNLEQIIYFNTLDTLSYTIIFKEDSTKQAEGNIVRNKLDYKIGKWYKYGDKITDSIVEYISVNNQSYINQIWVLDKETKDTIDNKGNFYHIFNDNTVLINDVLKYRFYLFQPYFSYDSDMLVVIPKNDNELKEDFSNIDEIETYSFHSLKNDGIPHPEIPKEVPQNHNTNFGLIYENAGEKRIRGAIVEYVDVNSKAKNGSDSITRLERRLFFDRKVYVKE